NLIKKGKVEERRQVIVARLTAIMVGIVATLLGILAEGVNVAVLVILAICIAASANFPVLALSLFWRRLQYRRRDRPHDARPCLFGRLGAYWSGLSRSQCALAAGEPDGCRLTARHTRRGGWQPARWTRCRTRKTLRRSDVSNTNRRPIEPVII